MQSDAVCWRYAGLLGFRFLDFDFKVGCRNFASTNDRARDFGVCDGGRVRGRLPATPCGQTLQGVSAAPRGYPLYAAGGQIISDPMISVFGGLSRGLDDRLIVAGPIARWALSPVPTSPRRSSRLAVARPDSRSFPYASFPWFAGDPSFAGRRLMPDRPTASS